MKNTKQQILKTLILILVTGFAISCSNTKQSEDQEHGEMMEDDQTEMMEGEDHDHDHMDENTEMTMDSTSMENEDMMQ